MQGWGTVCAQVQWYEKAVSEPCKWFQMTRTFIAYWAHWEKELNKVRVLDFYHHSDKEPGEGLLDHLNIILATQRQVGSCCHGRQQPIRSLQSLSTWKEKYVFTWDAEDGKTWNSCEIKKIHYEWRVNRCMVYMGVEEIPVLDRYFIRSSISRYT